MAPLVFSQQKCISYSYSTLINHVALLSSAFKVPFYLAPPGVLSLGIYGTALVRNIGETYGGAGKHVKHMEVHASDWFTDE